MKMAGLQMPWFRNVGLLLSTILLLASSAEAQIGLPAGFVQLGQVPSAASPTITSVTIASNGTTVTMTTSSAVTLNVSPLTPAVDGLVSNVQGSGGSSITTSLTTTQANDIVVADIQASFTGGDTAIGGISDTAGLTWATRGFATDGSGDDVIEYWAKAPAILTSDILTITFTHSTSFTAVSEFGLLNLNYGTPFDSHSGLPVTATSADPSFSTTATNTIAISGLGFGSTSTPTAGSGWTGITTGVANSFFLTEAKVFTTAQSGTSVVIGTGNGDQYASVTDALVAGSTTGGFSMSVAGVGDGINWTAPSIAATSFTGTLNTLVHSGVTVTYSVSTTSFTNPALAGTVSGASVTNNSTQ